MSQHYDSLPSLGHYDLIVAGGGAAGTGAAITAGRLGLSVLLIEQLSFLGGTGVASQVTPWMGNHIGMAPLNEGLTAELQRDLEALGAADEYTLNPEPLKGLLDQKCHDAGVTLLFEATVADTMSSEDAAGGLPPRLSAVIIATRGGLRRATAAAFIDATGDAHLAHGCGVPCLEGREGDGIHQPMSLRFVLGGLDLPRVRRYFEEGSAEPAIFMYHGLMCGRPGAAFIKKFAEQDGWPPAWLQTFTLSFGQIPGRGGELWFNCPRITGFDPLDPLSLSAAYVEGRRMIAAYAELFRRHVAGAEDVFVTRVAELMGIREGRRIVGLKTLTGDDFLARRKFEDGICFNRYPIDIHNAHDGGITWIEMAANDWHEIPFGCLVPRGVRGLLVAGRCISSDFSAQASYRIIPNCRTMGEASGAAAWLAKERGCDISEVDGREVRGVMLERGLLPNALPVPG